MGVHIVIQLVCNAITLICVIFIARALRKAREREVFLRGANDIFAWECERLTNERNAAVRDIEEALHTCNGAENICEMCSMKRPDCNWECKKAHWRGVQPESAAIPPKQEGAGAE